MFLRLRAKSVGEKVTIGLKPWNCSKKEGGLCENTTEVEINLEEVKVDKNNAPSSKIMLDDKIGIKMRYPDINTINLTGATSETAGMDVIRGCIDMIFTEEETHERDSFTDKELDEFIDSLNSIQMEKINNFFETMPTIKHTAKYTCKTCGEEKETTIQGLNSFFG